MKRFGLILKLSFVSVSKLTQDNRVESPIPILPLSTPDVETEKLIKMKDEEVSCPVPSYYISLHKLRDKVEIHTFEIYLDKLSQILTNVDVKFTVAENARDASENAAADARAGPVNRNKLLLVNTLNDTQNTEMKVFDLNRVL